MKKGNTTEILSEFAADLTFENIPKKVLEHIKLLFLDGVGCCIHGNTLPWTKKLMEVVVNNTDKQECTIIGTNINTSVLNAVLVNSTAGHGFEADDIHRESILHPNSIVVPVSINVSEKIKNINGKKFLEVQSTLTVSGVTQKQINWITLHKNTFINILGATLINSFDKNLSFFTEFTQSVLIN